MSSGHDSANSTTMLSVAAAGAQRISDAPTNANANANGNGTAAASATVSKLGGKALLIGINDYLAVPDLNGALNDIELIREILIKRFGFRPDDIEVLTQSDATRAGILAAIDRLAARVDPDDHVYFHYSGHGSQAADSNGDEGEDSRDETLVPHDGRTAGIRDITDDELAESLSKVRSDNVIVVLDSCHSGTATRGITTPRAIPMDPRASLYKEEVSSRAVVPLVRADFVLMSGAASHEEALDGPVDGRSHGLFSFALAQSISNAPIDATPRDIFVRVGNELERIKAQLGLRSMPEPQLEASVERLESPLFVKPAKEVEAARLPWVETAGSGGGQVRLVGAERLGAAKGSIWAIYGPGELAFAPGRALARAEVRRIEGGDALAKIIPGDISLAIGSRATPLAAAPPSGRVAVRIEDIDAQRAARLKAAITAQLPAVEFVRAGQSARFALKLDDATCQVLGADGSFEIESFAVGDEAKLVRALNTIFARSMTATEVLALNNPTTAIELQVLVPALEAARKQAKAPDVQRGMELVAASADAANFYVRGPGDPRTAQNSLQIRVRSNVDCYLTVVDVDSEGGVSLLFPNVMSERKGYFKEGRIERDRPVFIPDSLQSGNRSGFHIDYAPPSGTDTLRVFCSEDRAMALNLRSAIASLGKAADPSSRSAVRDTLANLRTELASRGVNLVADTPGTPGTPEPAPSQKTSAAPVPVSNPVAVAKPVSPALDWAAVSVTIEVTD